MMTTMMEATTTTRRTSRTRRRLGVATRFSLSRVVVYVVCLVLVVAPLLGHLCTFAFGEDEDDDALRVAKRPSTTTTRRGAQKRVAVTSTGFG